MSSQVTGLGTSSDGEFGANEWLVAELYEQFSKDKNSVDKAWWPILEAYQPEPDRHPPPSPPRRSSSPHRRRPTPTR